jgi:hypothetical protein
VRRLADKSVGAPLIDGRADHPNGPPKPIEGAGFIGRTNALHPDSLR